MPAVLQAANELNAQLLVGPALDTALGVVAPLGAPLAPTAVTLALDEAYVPSPAVPADSNGRCILWATGGLDGRLAETGAKIPRTKIVEEKTVKNPLTQETELKRFTKMIDATRYEVRADIPTYLEAIKAHEALAIGAIQARIDTARTLLKAQLGITDADFIEVPVVIKPEAGSWVAETGDSVNLLAVSDGARCKCLIPKPFGPVLAGAYVFEEYLAAKLAPLGVTYEFLNDWFDFHLQEGEIHCGTNQLPKPLAKGREKWWLAAPTP